MYFVVQVSEYYTGGYDLISVHKDEKRARRFRRTFWEGSEDVRIMSKDQYDEFKWEREGA